MILLRCPWCGPRNVQEFHYVDEVVARPPPDAATPEAWRAYLYLRANPCGWTREQWLHRAGCRRYFLAERHTQTNAVRATYPPARSSRAAGGDHPDGVAG